MGMKRAAPRMTTLTRTTLLIHYIAVLQYVQDFIVAKRLQLQKLLRLVLVLIQHFECTSVGRFLAYVLYHRNIATSLNLVYVRT